MMLPSKNLQQEIRRKLEQALSIAYQLAQLHQTDKAKNKAYLQKAFKIAEQTKSMTLLGVIRKSKAAAFGLPAEQWQKEKALAALIQQETTDPSANKQTKQKYHQFIRQLEKNYPAYYQLKYEDEPITIAAIQDSLLIENQALLAYVSTAEAFI